MKELGQGSKRLFFLVLSAYVGSRSREGNCLVDMGFICPIMCRKGALSCCSIASKASLLEQMGVSINGSFRIMATSLMDEDWGYPNFRK